MKLLKLILIYVSFSYCTLSAQELVSYEKISFISADQLTATYGIPFNNGVDFYRVLYSSRDITGAQDTLSGLACIPDDLSLSYPTLIYQHGTVGSREDVPSNLQGGYQIAEIFGGLQYVSIAPDFVGLGTGRGVHPYVHADSEAWAATDMLQALEELSTELDLIRNDQLFLTGYSQGGHAAMALHRSLEQDFQDQYQVTAAAPASGPYSISGKMIDFTLSDMDYFTPAYLASVTISIQAAYPLELAEFTLENIFNEVYVNRIKEFRDELIDLWSLNEFLIQLLNTNTGNVQPKDMLKPEILDAILNEPTHPMSIALQDNDVYDWTPEAPTRLYYCDGDEQVFFENALLAEEVMNANGATDLEAVNVGAGLDHNDCVTPAITNTVFFFGSLKMTSATYEIDLQGSYKILGNPVGETLSIESSQEILDSDYRIISVIGETLQSGHISGKQVIISTETLQAGSYYLIMENVNTVIPFIKN
jgi:pimeloyl-ACP methyl ester carboxylesterase